MLGEARKSVNENLCLRLEKAAGCFPENAVSLGPERTMSPTGAISHVRVIEGFPDFPCPPRGGLLFKPASLPPRPLSSPMSFLSRIWIIVLLGAGGFLVWVNHSRQQRVDYVSGLAGRVEATGVDAASATGYARGQRNLIVPERIEESFHWIAQTQQMVARGEGRVRQIDYENAPVGRPVHTASPYRWWLGAVAWGDHYFSGRPIGLAVERAALFADPVWHGLFLLGATGFVAWRFGAFAAALLAAGLVSVYPFAAGFLPGSPNDRGVVSTLVLGNILVLLAGLRDPARAARWFALAGVAGGVTLWLDVTSGVPVLVGVALGALLAAWRTRRLGPDAPAAITLPWRVWALSGAITVFASYLVEYFPDHLGTVQLAWIHPLYGLAWLGAGELLVRAQAWLHGKKSSWRVLDFVLLVFAVAAVVAVPAVMWATESRGFLTVNPGAERLTALLNGAVAANFLTWLKHDGLTAAVWAALLPLLVIGPAGWLLFRRATNAATRTALAIAFGPVLVALGFAWQQLGWWSLLDGALLGLLVAAIPNREATGARVSRWLWSGWAALFVVPGLMQLWPSGSAGAGTALTGREVQVLLERHLAHWLAKRTEESGAIVYAAPHAVTALCYYGGLRGLGTYAAENGNGLWLSLSIATADSMHRVRELLQARDVRYLVVPSWDPFFEEIARSNPGNPSANQVGRFVPELQRWRLPPWLRAVPYEGIAGLFGGFEKESVLVLEVVDEQPPALAACRLAEFLVESGKSDSLASATEALRRYRGDIGALVGLVQIQAALGDGAGAGRLLEQVVARLAAGADRALPWDRRVSLAIILAQGNQIELSQDQTRRCLAEMNPRRLRTLTSGSLFNFMVVIHGLGLEFPDPKLRESALDLLPPEARAQLVTLIGGGAVR